MPRLQPHFLASLEAQLLASPWRAARGRVPARLASSKQLRAMGLRDVFVVSLTNYSTF
jgi:hypothetical protein